MKGIPLLCVTGKGDKAEKQIRQLAVARLGKLRVSIEVLLQSQRGSKQRDCLLDSSDIVMSDLLGKSL